MNWAEAARGNAAEQTTLRTGRMHSQQTGPATEPQRRPLLRPTNTALPAKTCLETTNPPPRQGLAFPSVPGFTGGFHLPASPEASFGEPPSRRMSRRRQKGVGASGSPRPLKGLSLPHRWGQPHGPGCWKGWPHPKLLLLCSSLPKIPAGAGASFSPWLFVILTCIFCLQMSMYSLLPSPKRCICTCTPPPPPSNFHLSFLLSEYFWSSHHLQHRTVLHF